MATLLAPRRLYVLRLSLCGSEFKKATCRLVQAHPLIEAKGVLEFGVVLGVDVSPIPLYNTY